jgi:hypothetical protein
MYKNIRNRFMSSVLYFLFCSLALPSYKYTWKYFAMTLSYTLSHFYLYQISPSTKSPHLTSTHRPSPSLSASSLPFPKSLLSTSQPLHHSPSQPHSHLTLSSPPPAILTPKESNCLYRLDSCGGTGFTYTFRVLFASLEENTYFLSTAGVTDLSGCGVAFYYRYGKFQYVVATETKVRGRNQAESFKG